MKKSLKRNQEETRNLITKEIVGMTFVLFSVLSLFCMLLGDVIYPIGGIVRGFLLGAFGYYSFFFQLLCIFFGLDLILAKPLFSKRVRAIFYAVNVLLLCVLCIVQTFVVMKGDHTFFEFVQMAFGNREYNLTNATVGGVFLTCLVYPIMHFAGKFGVCLLYGLITLLCVLFILRRVNENVHQRKQKPTKETKKIFAKGIDNSEPISEKSNEENPKTPLAFNVISNPESRKSQLFLFGERSFSTKDRKAYGDSPMELDLAFNKKRIDEKFHSKPTNISENQSRSYTQSYSDELDSKVRYITTPPKPDLNSLGQSPTSAKNPNSHNAPSRISEVNEFGDRLQRKDVYNVDSKPSSNDGYSRISGLRDRNENVAPIVEEGFRDFANRNVDNESGERTISPIQKNRLDETVINGANGNVPSNVDSRFARAEFSSKSKLVSNSAPTQEQDGFNPVEIDAQNQLGATKVYNPLKSSQTSVEQNDFGSSSVQEDEKPSKTNVSFESLRNKEKRQEERQENVERTVKPSIPTPSPSFSTENVETSAPTQMRFSTATQTQAKNLKSESQEIVEKPNPIDLMPSNYRYKAPPLSLLNDYAKDAEAIKKDKELQAKRADIIVSTLKNVGIDVTVTDIIYGPTVTRFVIAIPQGVSVKTVLQAKQDLKLWLATTSEIHLLVPIPGTSNIGIEVPNSKPTTVGLKEIISSSEYRNISENSLSFALGKSIVGKPIFLNILDMPHLIVAGATGTGKSVCLNSMLISLLYRYSPEELRLIIVDPKIIEFEPYKGLPHLMFNDILINDGRALAMLDWACQEMDRRYFLFRDKSARKIQEYNKKIDLTTEKKLPYIIILIDEFAELMMTSNDKKKVQNYVGRLAQKARAAGISLIFATQRPSADVIDGTIKTNFTSRICFQTSSNVDSNVVLGESGAETLIGKGDVMYKISTAPNIDRAQGAFLDDNEVWAVTNYIREHNKSYYDEKALELINKSVINKDEDLYGGTSSVNENSEKSDPNSVEEVYLRALRLVMMTRNVSKTSLQTKLSVGYPKAAKIIDWMEEQGFISSLIDNKTRNIFITKEEYENRFGPFVESTK